MTRGSPSLAFFCAFCPLPETTYVEDMFHSRPRHMKTFVPFVVLIPSALCLLACPPATDHVRVKNASDDTMRLRFIFPNHAPEDGRLPQDRDDGYRLRYWMRAGVTDAEAGGTDHIPMSTYLRSAEKGFVLAIPPQHTLWIREYKTGSDHFPDTVIVDRGDEHRVLTKDSIKRRFRTHRSRDLF